MKVSHNFKHWSSLDDASLACQLRWALRLWLSELKLVFIHQITLRVTYTLLNVRVQVALSWNSRLEAELVLNEDRATWNGADTLPIHENSVGAIWPLVREGFYVTSANKKTTFLNDILLVVILALWLSSHVGFVDLASAYDWTCSGSSHHLYMALKKRRLSVGSTTIFSCCCYAEVKLTVVAISTGRRCFENCTLTSAKVMKILGVGVLFLVCMLTRLGWVI